MPHPAAPATQARRMSPRRDNDGQPPLARPFIFSTSCLDLATATSPSLKIVCARSRLGSGGQRAHRWFAPPASLVANIPRSHFATAQGLRCYGQRASPRVARRWHCWTTMSGVRRELNDIEYFNSLRQLYNLVVAVRVRGYLRADRLRRALDRAQRCHPLLGVNTEPGPGHVPWFTSAGVGPIPLAVVEGVAPDEDSRLAERELGSRFEMDRAAPARLPLMSTSRCCAGAYRPARQPGVHRPARRRRRPLDGVPGPRPHPLHGGFRRRPTTFWTRPRATKISSRPRPPPHASIGASLPRRARAGPPRRARA